MEVYNIKVPTFLELPNPTLPLEALNGVFLKLLQEEDHIETLSTPAYLLGNANAGSPREPSLQDLITFEL